MEQCGDSCLMNHISVKRLSRITKALIPSVLRVYRNYLKFVKDRKKKTEGGIIGLVNARSHHLEIVPE